MRILSGIRGSKTKILQESRGRKWRVAVVDSSEGPSERQCLEFLVIGCRELGESRRRNKSNDPKLTLWH